MYKVMPMVHYGQLVHKVHHSQMVHKVHHSQMVCNLHHSQLLQVCSCLMILYIGIDVVFQLQRKESSQFSGFFFISVAV